MIVYIKLFIEFFKAGLFSVGGGLATLPFLKKMAEVYPWFTLNELTDMIAISESTPGPIGVNMSTYAGFKAGFMTGGLPTALLGALVATASLVLPSVIVIIIISKVLEKFRKSKVVDDAFYGLRPASAGLIIGAMYDIFVSTFLYKDKLGELVNLAQAFNFKAIALFIVAFVLITRLKKVHPIFFIIGGCVIGIIFKF